ncbi:Swc3p Ecym_2624 [Eremothecium cymbalariae DBVPG|uniref:SWR1-complex protein 3 n=1 Tax=Eremothecium cymbalariae (strain CBS 270.75 / DBVPG 7215 / KCTC 17166 / NRRL Y-17582) TaxID=931890 RepID=G8JQK4_ERECY|nr:Hypothetical protein Ecym_2624 [Eremothecium cymbalariae DBVPG\
MIKLANDKMVRLRSRAKVSSNDMIDAATHVDAKTSSRKKKRAVYDDSNDLDTYGLVDDGNSSGRPFQIIEKLPCSVDPPRYDVFTHSLSVRDSAVLYNSLLASRRTWIKAEMFELYWSRQYMNIKERERMLKEGIGPDDIDQSAAREKMHKLCDCVMTGGPHTLPIRLFILKNDDIEQKWQEMQESKKKEKEMKRKKDAEDKEKRKEEKKKQQLLKKELKLKELEETKKEKEKRKKLQQEEQERIKKVKKESKKSTQHSGAFVKSSKPKVGHSQPALTKPQQQEIDNQKMIANLNLMAQKDPELNKLMISVANGEAPSADVEKFKTFIEMARKMDPPPNWKPKLLGKPLVRKPATKKASEVESKATTGLAAPQKISSTEKVTVDSNSPLSSNPSQNGSRGESSATDKNVNTEDNSDNSESIESTNKPVMNLKSADEDVQTSKAQKKSIADKSISETMINEGLQKDNDLLNIGVTDSNREDESKLNVAENTKEEPTVKNNEEGEINGSQLTSSISELQTSKKNEYGARDSKIQEDLGGQKSIDKDDPVLKTEYADGLKPKRKYNKKKKEPVEEEDKEMQLTTFQQKYLEDADILFEYLENPNIRFLFPKDAIFEQLEDEESYLMSWIIIHNKREVEQFKARKIREFNKNKKGRTSKEGDEKLPADFNIYEDPKCPPPLYTPMTVTISNIPKKFTPIIMNSINPTEKTQSLMSTIIKRGRRLTGYNLWFQLDAYDDKDLAESLRSELKEYEQGFKSKRQKKQL